MAADFAVLRHDIEIESGEDDGVIEVQNVLVRDRIQLSLPETKTVEINVDVAAPPQVAHLIVQDFDSLEDEVDFIAE